VAMIAGMLPTALGLGEGSESRQPMAIAVVSSTVLSLVLVPAFYELVEAIEKRITPYLARLVRSPDPDAEPEARPA